MQEIDHVKGSTPKCATITRIEQIPSIHGGWIYDVNFDNGWRCYVDPNNRNYHRWRQICERKQLVTLGGLRAKSKHKRIYNADSKIQIIGHAVSDELTQYEQLFTVHADEDNVIEYRREDPIEWRHMLELKEKIETATDLPHVEVLQMPDVNLQLADEMHVKDPNTVYIWPIALPY